MKAAFVNQLEPSQTVVTSFLVHSKEIREKRTGEPYLSLLLADRTGRVDAKMWDNVADVLEAFDRDDFVKIKGVVQLHLNRPQITIHKIRRLQDGEVEFGDYFQCSARDPEEMWLELTGIVEDVTNPQLRSLLRAFLGDPEIAARLKRAPAAKSIHHAFLGGLLEHILSLCKLGKSIGSHYPSIDVDLLVAGAVLHDVGKIHELTYARGFAYSTEGQLLGHIPIALRMIADKLRSIPDFPDPLRTLVEHIVLSHHGQLEFGSPKVPQFPEAILFHYLDDMDSKIECMRSLVEGDRQSTELFTVYSPSLERTVLKKDRFLTPPSVIESAASPIEPASVKPAPVAPKPATPDQDHSAQSVFGSKLLDALSK